MIFRNNVAGIVAVMLVLAYIAPIVFKLKDVALTLVILVGVVMMLIDLLQTLRSKGR
jgi:hypothetical protein